MKKVLATLFLAIGLVFCTTTVAHADNVLGEVLEGLTGIDFDRDNPYVYNNWSNPYMGYYGTPSYYGAGYYGGYYGGVNPYLNLYTAPTVGFPYYNFY